MRQPAWLANGAYARFRECVALAAIALVAFELAVFYPTAARRSPGEQPWRERNYQVWYHSHQIFERDPDELNDIELQRLLAYCRCLKLISEHGENQGMDNLTSDECLLVAELLEEICPDVGQHLGYRSIYKACQQRLAAGENRIECHEAGP